MNNFCSYLCLTNGNDEVEAMLVVALKIDV